jgi:3D (Asp-Asp-Asp) domain-containing protein
MTRGQKGAAALLAICFTFGAIVGAIITALIVKAQDSVVYMPQTCYQVITETEAKAKLEEETLEPEEAEEARETPKVEPKTLGKFKLTAYCTCSKCCGKWADGITASGTAATPGRTIAVDKNVIPLGSKVTINGYEYTAEDTGSAIKGNRIDILFPTHQDALNFGIQYAEVAIIKN